MPFYFYMLRMSIDSRVVAAILGDLMCFLVKFAGLFLMLIAQSCVTGGGVPKGVNKRFLNQKLMGKIAANDWSYQYAYVDPTVDTGSGNDFALVFLPDKPKKTCPRNEDLAESNGIMVITKESNKPVTLKAGRRQMLAFQYFEAGDLKTTIAKSGKIHLTSRTDSFFKGRLRGYFNSKFYVNGHFKATVCSFMDMRERVRIGE